MASGFVYGYVRYPIPLEKQITVLIPRGTSIVGVGEILEQEGVLRYAPLFPIMTAIFHPDTHVQAGEYRFIPGITPLEVLAQLHEGRVVYRRITVPEGQTTWQVLKLLAETETMTGGLPDFEEVGEGTLFPETYYYLRNDPRDFMIQRMQQRQRDLVAKLWRERTVDSHLIGTKRQALILASLVQREAGHGEQEHELVASVFLNRLAKGMRLQSDPTVIYAVSEGTGELNRPLSKKDLWLESPYNTYRNHGLPPTPISNVGERALRAVLMPMESDYYYFVANADGGHWFSRNLEEHNRNVAKYRAKLKAQRASSGGAE